MSHRNFLLCAVLSLGLGLSCAHAPWDRTHGWSANKSQNAVVYSDTTSAHRWWQEGIEEAFAAYSGSFFAGLPIPPVQAIYLQRELGPVFRVKRMHEDPPRSWTLAYLPTVGQIGKEGLVILEDANRTRSRKPAALQVAFHFIGHTMPKAPLWFQVGMAHYLSGHRLYSRGDERLTCFGTPCGHVRLEQDDRGSQRLSNQPQADVLMGISEMFATDWQTYNDKWRYWFANTAYTFINYLIHGIEGVQANQFGKLMLALAQGKGSWEAIRTTYPNLDVNTLDRQVQDHRIGQSCALAQFPTVPQGACFKISPTDNTAVSPIRTAIPEGEMTALFTALARLPLLEKHAAWYPSAVVMQYTHLPPTGDQSTEKKAGVSANLPYRFSRNEPEAGRIGFR